jgi:hypothetical protein
MRWTVRSLFLVKERRQKPVRMEADVSDKVQIVIKTAKRNKEGKIEYETQESFNILDATPAEVINVVERALNTAVGKK